ncbi:MAG: S8 family serine peptidase [Bdellovibrionaceae bacterium]|nr:S8 family serine peptidase [Pseudobdellovibrionaceae bacterium]MDW8190227.1 S8 family serine peptidase [Pseudobdellovibrionaceae bacterium]
MKIAGNVFSFILLSFMWLMGAAFNKVHGQGTSGPAMVHGEFLIKLKGQPQVFKSQSFIGKFQGKTQLKAAYGQLGIHHVRVKPNENIEDVLQQLKNDPDVAYVEPNYVIKLTLPEEDERSIQSFGLEEGYQWLLQRESQGVFSATSHSQLGVPEVWQKISSHPQQLPVVAVIDSGVDYNHPVFVSKGAIWKNELEVAGYAGQDDDGNGYRDDVFGWNFAENNANPMDSDAPDIRSHGTHVAGIILGVTQPYSSEAPARIKIMPLKFLGSGGTGTTGGAVQAIYYAVRNGAKIINMSWGGPHYSQALHDALAYAYSQGALLVAAAGNSAKNNDVEPMFPANFPIPSQLTVAAVNDFDNLAFFSNFGVNRVPISAPGVAIYSTSVGGYRVLSGTSMAAPFIAGVAALVMSERPDLTAYQVRNLIFNSASHLPSLMQKVTEGSRVQVLATILNSQSHLIGERNPPPYDPSGGSNASRAPASQEGAKAGGCGMISTSIFQSWFSTSGPGAPWSPKSRLPFVLGLTLLPLILWQILRLKAQITDFANRRRHERFFMNSAIKVKIGERELVGQMNTISAGGLSFQADQMLEKGGLVTLQIQSPNGEDTIEVQGRIVWSEANKAYGVQFSEEKSEVQSWGRFLKKVS